MSCPRVIVIAGPTAVGKTEAALKLAETLRGEIVSADSMQVYRYMDIGTAKPTPAERSRIPHHLLDVVKPDESFSAARFTEIAGKVIEDLYRRQVPIFIVGGTGLYIRALLGGLFAGPNADPGLRDAYRQHQERYGTDYLYSMLQRMDKRAAERIEPRDTVRIIRALEVMTLTGRSIVAQQEEHGFSVNRYKHLKIGLSLERPVLNERIEHRTRKMVQAGWIDETQQLLDKGYSKDLKPMQSLGYKHIVLYLQGQIDLDEAIHRTIQDTRRYAKRQGTWFRAESDMDWYLPNEFDKIKASVQRFLDGDNRDFA